jgi:hypothetical protein
VIPKSTNIAPPSLQYEIKFYSFFHFLIIYLPYSAILFVKLVKLTFDCDSINSNNKKYKNNFRN